MTVPYVDVDPDAILIPQRFDASALGDGVLREDLSRWHIVDPEREITWCGLFLSQGSERRPLSETPEDQRCATCLSRVAEASVVHPVAEK